MPTAVGSKATRTLFVLVDPLRRCELQNKTTVMGMAGVVVHCRGKPGRKLPKLCKRRLNVYCHELQTLQLLHCHGILFARACIQFACILIKDHVMMRAPWHLGSKALFVVRVGTMSEGALETAKLLEHQIASLERSLCGRLVEIRTALGRHCDALEQKTTLLEATEQLGTQLAAGSFQWVFATTQEACRDSPLQSMGRLDRGPGMGRPLGAQASMRNAVKSLLGLPAACVTLMPTLAAEAGRRKDSWRVEQRLCGTHAVQPRFSGLPAVEPHSKASLQSRVSVL